jgi:hypothetical protein
MVLSVQSPIFKAMFQGNFKENLETSVQLSDVDPVIMGHVLKYCYTSVAVIPKDVASAIEILLVADRFDVANLRKELEWFLVQRISLENSLSLYHSLTLMPSLQTLKSALIAFILQNYLFLEEFDENRSTLIDILKCVKSKFSKGGGGTLNNK